MLGVVVFSRYRVKRLGTCTIYCNGLADEINHKLFSNPLIESLNIPRYKILTKFILHVTISVLVKQYYVSCTVSLYMYW